MADARFDLIVIGSGPAGEKAAAQAAYFGKKVAVIEAEPEPGGAAVHTGTLPSKTRRPRRMQVRTRSNPLPFALSRFVIHTETLLPSTTCS